MGEALNEIVQMLTEPTFQRKMIVIFAGYEEEISELLHVNPGLKSRMSETLRFPNLTAGDASKLLLSNLRSKLKRLSPAAEGALPALLAPAIAARGWSNGRTLDTLARKLFSVVAVRRARVGGSEEVEVVDLEAAIAGLGLSDSAPAGAAADAQKQSPLPRARVGDRAAPTYAPILADVADPVAKEADKCEAHADPKRAEVQPQKTFFDARLTPKIMNALQKAADTLGKTADDPEAFANDPDVIDHVAIALGLALEKVSELMQLWKSGQMDAVAFDAQMKLQGTQPLWRCSAGCERRLHPPPGSPWCIGPYIEGWETVDLPA